MKMVRSLLLGSAAGLVAVTAGQAADIPVKAKPVQYVKICSLYGAGFYYMPGTDMCLKIGGWVRGEVTWGINGNSTTGTFNQDQNNRATNNLWTRERGYITADAREQTAYGVARGYIAVGISSQNNGNEANSGSFSANRAYVQWAGFTAGLAVSFFDFYPAAALLYRAAQIPSEDTGDGGFWVWAYTAQLGGGLSATLSAEERRTSQIIGQGSSATVLGQGTLPGAAFAAGAGYGGWQAPDVVANLRIDQAWGSAQVMAAAHELNPLYYAAGGAGGASTSLQTNGHPGDQWGWVVGGGAKINTPFVSPGDYFVFEVNYTQGATKYLNSGPSNENQSVVQGATQAYGVGADCVFGGTLGQGNATGCLMTTAWSFNAAYEHYWTPQWHQSIAGGYLAESYGTQANNILCSLEGGSGVGNGAGVGSAAAATPGCSNNWNMWGVGSRLQWDVTKSFYIGVEAIYQSIQSAQSFNGLVPSSAGTPAPSVCGAANNNCVVGTVSNWVFTVRMHKDFLP
jgi:hypothetical protein